MRIDKHEYNEMISACAVARQFEKKSDDEIAKKRIGELAEKCSYACSMHMAGEAISQKEYNDAKNAASDIVIFVRNTL